VRLRFRLLERDGKEPPSGSHLAAIPTLTATVCSPAPPLRRWRLLPVRPEVLDSALKVLLGLREPPLTEVGLFLFDEVVAGVLSQRLGVSMAWEHQVSAGLLKLNDPVCQELLAYISIYGGRRCSGRNERLPLPTYIGEPTEVRPPATLLDERRPDCSGL